jgi:hypothetical protein
MDIGSIFVLLALLILVVIYIARPILERNRSTSVSQEEHDLSALLAERDRTVNALQELEFDYELGKIPEEDYPAQRARMIQYGVELLRKLDAYQPLRQKAVVHHSLEEAIARRAAQRLTPAVVREAQPNGSNGASDDELEVMIAQRRRLRNGKTAGFCHQCGSPLQQSDRFCPRCGHKMN